MQLHGALARFPLVEAENFRRQQHVVENGAPLQQHGFLKDDADVARGMQERRAVEEKLAAAGPDQRADELEQGRLAATRRADEGDELVLLDRERDVFERRDPTVTRSVGLVQPLDLDLAQRLQLGGRITSPPSCPRLRSIHSSCVAPSAGWRSAGQARP